MNREDISRLILDAGNGDEEWAIIAKQLHKHFPEELEAFAKLVAQHEREECIKACEQVTADLKNYASAFEGITAETKFVRNIGGIVGEPFVDAIRARGQA